MSKNYGPNVSRVLDSENRNFTNVVFQQKRPPLDSEWNLVQDIQSDKHRELLQKMVPSGFLELGDIRTAPEDRSQLNASWANAFVFKNPTAVVNGWMVNIGGGTNQFQEGAQGDIWTALSGDEKEVAIIGPSAPDVGYRQDVIFLEVWKKLVETSDFIYKNGFVQSSLPKYTNDLIDQNIEIETSKRVQIQYRFRWVTGVDFLSYRDGLGHPACVGRGASSSDTAYVFYKHSDDVGLYVSGDGSDAAKIALQSIDGYSYAIPVARVHRRNKMAYALTNPNGSAISLLSGDVSDRPDGLYFDEISFRDLEDLRHRVYLNNLDYSSLLEENINLLWNKQLPSELKFSPSDTSLAGNILTQTDGISRTGSRSGIDDTNRDPDGIIRCFTEAQDTQVFSLYLKNIQTNGGKVWFCPIAHQENPSYEYKLYDDTKVYISDETPTVRTYDTTTNTITLLSGGTWFGLGEKRPWGSPIYPVPTPPLSSTVKNKITYTPTDRTLVENKDIIFTFKLKIREGSGVATTNKAGGFNYNIKKMLYGENSRDGFPVDFNLYTDAQRVVTLSSPRKTGTFTDSAIARSINSFESAALPGSTSVDRYKSATCEIKYFKRYDGTTFDTIPTQVYSRDVISILSIFNVTKSRYMFSSPGVVPGITRVTAEFQISGLEGDPDDVLEYTLLAGNYSVDYVPHTRGIRNFASTYRVSNTIIAGDTQGLLNIKSKTGWVSGDPTKGTCDAILSVAGFYNGVSYKHIAYVNNKMVLLSSVDGLGSPIVKYTLEEASAYSGTISIPLLGYYNPITADQFYFQYEYQTYPGILQSRLGSSEVQRVRVLKVDDKVGIITAGTGSEAQYCPESMKGLASFLPINNKVLEYNLFGENVVTPITGGSSSVRRVPSRGFSQSGDSSSLKEGDVLNIVLGDLANNTRMLRGAVIDSPKISESGIPFSTPFNHMNQWSAIVEGLDEFRGELFLMVITSVSTIYNFTESPNDKYLEQKGIYQDNALGMGAETVFRNDVSRTQLLNNLGTKIYGAVDLFPLKNRPIIISAEI